MPNGLESPRFVSTRSSLENVSGNLQARCVVSESFPRVENRGDRSELEVYGRSSTLGKRRRDDMELSGNKLSERVKLDLDDISSAKYRLIKEAKERLGEGKVGAEYVLVQGVESGDNLEEVGQEELQGALVELLLGLEEDMMGNVKEEDMNSWMSEMVGELKDDPVWGVRFLSTLAQKKEQRQEDQEWEKKLDKIQESVQGQVKERVELVAYRQKKWLLAEWLKHSGKLWLLSDEDMNKDLNNRMCNFLRRGKDVDWIERRNVKNRVMDRLDRGLRVEKVIDESSIGKNPLQLDIEQQVYGDVMDRLDRGLRVEKVIDESSIGKNPLQLDIDQTQINSLNKLRVELANEIKLERGETEDQRGNLMKEWELRMCWERANLFIEVTWEEWKNKHWSYHRDILRDGLAQQNEQWEKKLDKIQESVQGRVRERVKKLQQRQMERSDEQQGWGEPKRQRV